MSKLDSLLKQINKDAKCEVVRIGVVRDDPDRLPTGIFQLDLAIGGGLPKGRIAILYGPESSMKTTVALKALKNAQKLIPNKRAVFVDLEHTLTKSWAQKLGVDTDSLIHVKPHNAEQAVDIIVALAHEGEDVSVVVVDSLAALVTNREIEESAEKAMVGVQGLLINKLYRKLSQAMGAADENGGAPTMILINQIRFKVGVMMGDPETMPGGPSFKFASSLTLRLYGKDEFLKEVSTSLPAYKKISAIVKKWKVPITARNCEFVVATVDNPKLKLTVGQSYDMGSLMHYLKSFELLVKGDKAGWILRDDHGEILGEFKTLDAVEARIRDDAEFSDTVRGLIVREVLEKGDLLDSE
jgi:recombination protein RecA